jgi:hypothetical protein
MGFVDIVDEQEIEYKYVCEQFALEFARLRTMIKDIEVTESILRVRGERELPSTEYVTKARTEILEDSFYVLVSKGNLNLKDDINDFKVMLENVSDAIGSIDGVREEYSDLRRLLDEDLEDEDEDKGK